MISTTFGEAGVKLAKKEVRNTTTLDLGLTVVNVYQVLPEIRGFSSVPVVIDREDVRTGARG